MFIKTMMARTLGDIAAIVFVMSLYEAFDKLEELKGKLDSRKREKWSEAYKSGWKSAEEFYKDYYLDMKEEES